MKVRFLQTREVQDGTATVFEAGRVYDLPDASAARWMRRGLAEPLPQLDELRMELEPPPPSDPPPRPGDASQAGDNADPPSETSSLQLDPAPPPAKGARSRKS